MKALNSLIVGMTLLLGGVWVAEASATPGGGSKSNPGASRANSGRSKANPGASKAPSIHNCPGYGLTRRAHGGECPPPPSQNRNTPSPKTGQTGKPVTMGLSPNADGTLSPGLGVQGNPGKGPGYGAPFKGAKSARRSVSDLFFDEDTGASFLRRAEPSHEPLLSERTPSAEDTALLRRQAALGVYIREALEATKLDNWVASRSVPSTDQEIFELQSRDAQPVQEVGYDNALWSRVAAQAEQDFNDLYVRTPEAADDIGVYSREATYDEQPLWGRSPNVYEERPIPV